MLGVSSHKHIMIIKLRSLCSTRPRRMRWSFGLGLLATLPICPLFGRNFTYNKSAMAFMHSLCLSEIDPLTSYFLEFWWEIVDPKMDVIRLIMDSSYLIMSEFQSITYLTEFLRLIKMANLNVLLIMKIKDLVFNLDHFQEADIW